MFVAIHKGPEKPEPRMKVVVLESEEAAYQHAETFMLSAPGTEIMTMPWAQAESLSTALAKIVEAAKGPKEG